jgi:hypothetical protein
MTNPTDLEEGKIMALLQRELEQLDPVPPHVTEFAKAALSWRTIDAELAQLAHDSTDPATHPAMKSTASARLVGFETGDWIIDLRHDAGTSELRGRIEPARSVEVQLHLTGAVLTTETDDLGRFTFEGVEAGPVALVIRVAGGESVKSEWIFL